MKITSLGICRANQKIYEKLRAEGLGEGQELGIVFGEEADARPLLCTLYPLGSGEYVAVTPDLPLAQASYTLAAIDADGRIAQSERRTVSFDGAKWQSRINYRLHKDLCDQIRCFDETHPAPDLDAFFGVASVTSCPTCMKFRLHLTFPGKGEDAGRLRFVMLRAENLEPLATTYVPMGTRTLPAAGPGAEPDHKTAITVDVPWDAGDILAYAWEEGRPGLLVQRRLEKAEWEGLRLSLDNMLFNNAGMDPYYDEWFRLHRVSPHTLKQQRQVRFKTNPKFSVIVPLYKTPVDLFDAMIASVEAQSYANWECVLVNSTPEVADLKERVAAAAARDSRIKVVELPENLGISLNTNAGVAEATGDYICFFDHDDVLEADILFEYAKAVDADPAVDMLYCDEDKLAGDGRYFEAFFKPDFSLDLLRNNNYICHMLCVRAKLLAELEPNTRENDGAQDHNTTLQVAEHTTAIHHVPKVLYHWRVTEGSTAAASDAKSYANDAGIKAVSDHLKRMGCDAEVSLGDQSFTYTVRYAVPEPAPLVSIIIPTCDHIDLLRVCLESIASKTTYPNYEVVVVENNSREQETFDYYETLAADQRVNVVRWQGEGFNFSELVNFGRKAVKGDYLLLLNNDTEVITPDWIERMVGNAARPEVGCVGAKLYYPDDTVQHAGVVIADDAGHCFLGLPRENPGYFNFATKPRDVAAVTGACLMVSAALFDELGGFDPALAVAYNDVDFCLRALAKKKLNVVLPDVELYHYESVSRGYDEDPKSRARYYKEKALMMQRFAEVLGFRDPYYNPNLMCRLPEAAYYHF